MAQPPSNGPMAYLIGGVIVFMVGVSFASVPLYRMFCQATGYGGTPKLVLPGASGKPVATETIKIRFNADVHRNLPWDFKPLQTEMVIYPGAQATVFYEVTNHTKRPMVGIASYNVTPDKAGAYFNKIECFCFDEQRIPSGKPMTLPVQFFIDPDILRDHPDIKTITLSYTFYEIKDFKWP